MACLFGIVHYKFIAFNCLKVFENSTIWRPQQEDQDRSIPPSFDLEERTGQSNAFPKAPSAHQENPKFLPVVPLLPTKLLSDELKDRAAYITFTLQMSKGSVPGTPTYRKSIRTFEEGDPQQCMEVITGLKEIRAQNSGTPTYRKSIRTFEEGDPQQWMEVITGLKEIWAQNSITVPTDMSNTVVAILKGDSRTSYEAAMEDNCTNPEDKSLMVPCSMRTSRVKRRRS
jgi:hypothetical protein